MIQCNLRLWLWGRGAGAGSQIDVAPFRQYNPMQWISGIVDSTSSFGIFVTIPCPDDRIVGKGLVPITEISDEFVESAAGQVDIGQQVEVRVVRAEDGRIDLSMRAPGPR